MPRRKQASNPNESDTPCPACGTLMLVRTVQVVAGSCWQCNGSMPIAFGNDGVMMMGPPEFTDIEREAAIAAGANLQMQRSETMNSTYLANTCACGAFTGDFYLHDFWYEQDVVPPMKLILACPKCGVAVSAKPAADGRPWRGTVQVA